MLKRILFISLLFASIPMKAQQGLVISGTLVEFYKSLYEDTYDTSSFNFELLLRDNQYWWQFSREGVMITYQSFDYMLVGYGEGSQSGMLPRYSAKNERLLPVPLKMNKSSLLFELHTSKVKDTLRLGNKLLSNVLDSVIWNFQGWGKGMRYEMSAHMGSKKQHQIVEYAILSIHYENLDSLISLRERRWEKELPEELVKSFEKATELRAENRRVQENFDSLYIKIKANYQLKNETVIYWYKGCIACSKLMLDLNRSEIPDTAVVLFNPVDSEEVASEYLSGNSIRFKNYCVANTSEIRAYPTILFKGPKENPNKIYHEVGYSKETFATILMAIETKTGR